MPPEETSTQDLRVAYVIGRAPQPSSTFTNDEVAALREHVRIVPCGLVAASSSDAWITAPGTRSVAIWWAAGKWLARRPHTFLSTLATLVVTSLATPRDAAVALRSALAGAYLASCVDVDVIHAQFAGPAAAGAFVWHRLTGVPYTIRAHAYDIYRPYRWAGTVMRSSAAVISISDHGAAEIRRRWGIDSLVVRVGIDARDVPMRDARPCRRPLRVLSVGALEPKKGHDILIGAVKQANLTGCLVELDIYGDGSLRSHVRELAEHQRITLKGHVEPDQLRKRYRDYDAFALAARTSPDGDTDGIPVVLMEASLAGLPVVTTTVGGIPELIQDGVGGWATEPVEEQISGALCAVAAEYPAARRRAAVARARVRELHDLRTVAKQLARRWASLSRPGWDRPA